MKYEIPFLETLEINTILLDLNGTLSVNGTVPSGVKERLKKLTSLGFTILLLTGNQRENADDLCVDLGIDYEIAKTSREKSEIAKQYEKEHLASIGNARIDIGMFEHSKLSIATLQSEGIHTGILSHIDILVPSIIDALDLFINTNSLKATMRI